MQNCGQVCVHVDKGQLRARPFCPIEPLKRNIYGQVIGAQGHYVTKETFVVEFVFGVAYGPYGAVCVFT